VGLRFVAVAVFAMLTLSACGLLPAGVRDGCYRFDDGTPLFKIVGKKGVALSHGSQVRTFAVGGWHDLARTRVEIRPAFDIPGLGAGDPRRGDTMLIPTISYSTFAFDPKRNAFQVPIEAYGDEEVRLGQPC